MAEAKKTGEATKAEVLKSPDGKELRKVSVKKINLSKESAGFVLEGKFKCRTESEPFQETKRSGEIVTKTLTFVHLLDKDGEELKVIQDKGLQSAMIEAGVKEGQWFRAVKLEKTELKGGRTMNCYEMYV